MNKIPHTKILSSHEYTHQLHKKLEEEVAEFLESKELIELADILEVVYAIAKNQGSSTQELENLRIKKAKERGAFAQKIYLESVEEPNT